MAVQDQADIEALYNPDEFGCVFSVNGGGEINGLYQGPYAAALDLGPAGVGVASEDATLTCPQHRYAEAAEGDVLAIVRFPPHQSFLDGRAFTVAGAPRPDGSGHLTVRLEDA